MEVMMPRSKYMYLTQVINSLIARNEDRIKLVGSQERNALYISTFFVHDLGFVFSLVGKFARADPLLAIYTLTSTDTKRSIFQHPLKLRENLQAKTAYLKQLEDLTDDERVLHDYLVNLYAFYN